MHFGYSWLCRKYLQGIDSFNIADGCDMWPHLLWHGAWRCHLALCLLRYHAIAGMRIWNSMEGSSQPLLPESQDGLKHWPVFPPPENKKTDQIYWPPTTDCHQIRKAPLYPSVKCVIMKAECHLRPSSSQLCLGADLGGNRVDTTGFPVCRWVHDADHHQLCSCGSTGGLRMSLMMIWKFDLQKLCGRFKISWSMRSAGHCSCLNHEYMFKTDWE